jgi:hypothetical protein
MRKEVRGGGRRELHNEKLHDVYFSSRVTRAIQSRRIRWVGHVAFMEEK